MENVKQNLLEQYGRQIKIAEAFAKSRTKIDSLDDNIKLATAVCLDNVNKFISMRESMNTMATERANLGDYKKFCLNLVNLSVPTLIANNLVIVHPMTSFSGSVAYLEYQSRTNKGDVKRGQVFNSVFNLGETGEARTNFTSQVIIETITTAGGKVALSPMHFENGRFTDTTGAGKDVKVVHADGTVEYFDVTPSATAGQPGTITGYTAAKDDKVAYFSEEFQMEHVPAQDIPTIGPVMKRIPLVAEPRRIGVKYDQISAFQAKTDYGFNLDKQIAEQAVGELNFEIDSEIIGMLYQAAVESTKPEEFAELTWSKTQPIGVSKFEHYNGFLEVIEAAKAIIYKRTKRFEPTYMVVDPDLLRVLKFVNGWTANKGAKKNGPYKAGDIDGLDIYVTPDLIGTKEFFFGLNGSDMMSSVAVYAPYMPIVPTQLLGTPDGGLQQGFSTWYATAFLNKNLAVRGKITD